MYIYVYIYIYIWLHVLLPLSPFPASAILVGSACSKTASVAGWTPPENSGGKIHESTIYIISSKNMNPDDPQDTTIYIYIYLVCSLYMILYNIHLPIIYMYMTCISDILLVYHLTDRLPSRSLWQHLQQIVWQGLIGHHLYTFLHCRGLYHFCRKPILEAD